VCKAMKGADRHEIMRMREREKEGQREKEMKNACYILRQHPLLLDASNFRIVFGWKVVHQPSATAAQENRTETPRLSQGRIVRCTLYCF
jgi:hypothetical protein